MAKKTLLSVTYTLSLITVILLLWSAGKEPFMGEPKVMDGLLCVGLGAALIFAWAALFLNTLWTKYRKKSSQGYWYLFIAPPIAIFYLQFTVYGYMADTVKNYNDHYVLNCKKQSEEFVKDLCRKL